jgi:Ni/Co efflux regulator RcnB
VNRIRDTALLVSMLAVSAGWASPQHGPRGEPGENRRGPAEHMQRNRDDGPAARTGMAPPPRIEQRRDEPRQDAPRQDAPRREDPRHDEPRRDQPRPVIVPDRPNPRLDEGRGGRDITPPDRPQGNRSPWTSAGRTGREHGPGSWPGRPREFDSRDRGHDQDRGHHDGDQDRDHDGDHGRDHDGDHDRDHRGDHDGHHDGNGDRNWDRNRWHDYRGHYWHHDRGWYDRFRNDHYYFYGGQYTARQRFFFGYYNPPTGYSTRFWTRGDILPYAYYDGRYFIDDYLRFDLYDPPFGCRWVRVRADALLVDIDSGEILDVVRDLYW